MKDEFLITRQGKQYVLFAGLLDEAHNRGLSAIETDLIQVPAADNDQTAICKATVTMADERSFCGIGDASPQNVGRNITPHIIRMAETRAKARALRDAVNVGVTALEELSEGEDQGANRTGSRYGSRSASRSGGGARWQGANRPQNPAAAESGGEVRSSATDETPASEEQVELLRRLATDLRGEDGVSRLESLIGKPLTSLSASEVEAWIERLASSGGANESAASDGSATGA